MCADEATERRERFRRQHLEQFRSSVEWHFDNPPNTWALRKVAERAWRTETLDGATIQSFTTKREGARSLDLTGDWHQFSPYVREYFDRQLWYLGYCRDPRSRQLTEDEQRVVAEVLDNRSRIIDKDAYMATAREDLTHVQ